MTFIPIHQLEAHPRNANRMLPALVKKLKQHIEETGHYPPLIVRPLPDCDGKYQILDGHHRAEILRSLNHENARCEIWDVNDERAEILLLTLNRLHGEDDPQRRGALLENLTESIGYKKLSQLVPESLEQIQRTIATNHPPPEPAEPPDLETMPQAITFFLTTH